MLKKRNKYVETFESNNGTYLILSMWTFFYFGRVKHVDIVRRKYGPFNTYPLFESMD